MRIFWQSLLVGLAVSFWGVLLSAAEPAAQSVADRVSYYEQIRPLFQAHCQGCHQPAKASGGYVMTDFALLQKGGESGDAAINPGKPQESSLLKLIAPDQDGHAEMPKDKPALPSSEFELIQRWIAEGALDDTPAGAKHRFDQAHPPVYSRPPVITSLDFSPDGKLLAVAGFHEVLLVEPESGDLAARLIGLSERIESVRFSPDGSKLAVTGGLPGRMGEVQVWDVTKRELVISVPVTFDTVYGGSWSPDGRWIAFGCSDNTARAIDAATGEQVVQQGTHTDWVLGTSFSPDGTHLVSVGRDMTAKLTEVATQRFIDNITSITPGALKGGIQAVAMHPQRAEILVGGSDSKPKLYRIFRTTARRIGDDANLIRSLPAMAGRVFSVAISRDGKRVAAGAALDNRGEVFVADYPPEFDSKIANRIRQIESKAERERTPQEKDELAQLRSGSDVKPARTEIRAGVYAVAFHPDGLRVAAAGSDGIVRLINSADGEVVKQLSPAPVAQASASVSTLASQSASDFIRDVNPIMSRLGCNQGTCHGAAKGKNGFKLSLRGYDAIHDIRALTDDLKSRRVNVAAPDESLMLLKSTGSVPHVGGQLVKPGEPYYQTIRDWIAGGAALNLNTPRVVRIDISPLNPTVEKIGDQQAMKVLATFADGVHRDVTREAFVESGNTDICTVDRQAVVTTVRRGEAPLLARYEGAYAATTLTVMGDRSGFVWEQPPTHNRIDELTTAKWKRLKIKPSDLCSDAEFLRRVYLDLIGLPPQASDVRAFLADSRDTRVKRDEIVDRLIGSADYVEYWTNKWADLLQVNRKFLGAEGAAAFRQWIRTQVESNTPYDRFARLVLTATGSNKDNPAAAYFKILREPAATMENTTHLFLGVRFNCNKCHDHPFEKWTQDQYYQTAAYFAQYELKKDSASGDKTIGGTAVEGAKPLYEVVADSSVGEVLHDRTGQPTPPKFPYELVSHSGKPSSAPADHRQADSTRREQFAAWLASPDNPYFAKSYVNRLWGYLLGVGIMEPIDDLRAGNPPSNPELLDFLTQELIASGFDARHVMRLICKSRTYQLSVAVNRWNHDDKLNYSHAVPRRLLAEVLYDAVHRVAGSTSKLPDVPAGTRAAALPDSGIELPSGFFTTFGRPARESACECERSSGLQLGPVMALISGPTIADAISEPNNEIAKLVESQPDDRELVNEIFLRVLNRSATDSELNAVLEASRNIDSDHEKLVAALTQREVEAAALQADLEKKREADIVHAKQTLADYEKELAPRLAELEKQKAIDIAKAEKELNEYQATLPEKIASWEKPQTANVEWISLLPTAVEGPQEVTLSVEQDRSIVVDSKNAKGVINVTLPTQLKNITALRLEALADERSPRGGPGRSNDGNFVLTEIEVFAAPASDPKQQTKVDLQKPLADFSQENFSIDKAIDGNAREANGGWAVSPAIGATHWATFETKQPIGYDGGMVFKVSLHHRFKQPNFLFGRFRISIAVDKSDVGVSLADDLRAILTVPATKRSEQQSAYLVKYFRTVDPGLREREKALTDSKQPLPVDPRLQDLRETVELVSRPVPPDARLTQLKSDVELSTQQIGNKRLTNAQDLVWALINSPAFLFNR